MLKNIILDDNARTYVQMCLRQGNSFAQALLNALLLGKVTTYFPEQLDYSQVDLSQSVYLATGIRIYDDARNKIYETVNSFLQEGKNRYALLETYYTPDHLRKMKHLPDIAYCGDEVYFFLSAVADSQKIKHAFSSARDYPFICGLIDLSEENIGLQKGQSITVEQFNALAQNTSYIIIGAFDNEGYLIWKRESLAA